MVCESDSCEFLDVSLFLSATDDSYTIVHDESPRIPSFSRNYHSFYLHLDSDKLLYSKLPSTPLPLFGVLNGLTGLGGL